MTFITSAIPYWERSFERKLIELNRVDTVIKEAKARRTQPLLRQSPPRTVQSQMRAEVGVDSAAAKEKDAIVLAAAETAQRPSRTSKALTRVCKDCG